MDAPCDSAGLDPAADLRLAWRRRWRSFAALDGGKVRAAPVDVIVP